MIHCTYFTFALDLIVFTLCLTFSSFRGFTKSHIFYDDKSFKWVLESLLEPEYKIATRGQWPNQIPIGSYEWRIARENGACQKPNLSIHKLTFTQCYPNLFTCNTGHCTELKCVNIAHIISIALTLIYFFFFLRNRCDIKHDCSDESDEISCDYLRTDKNYAKELLPIDSGKRPCLVYINASFLAFPSIDTSTLKFTADLYLHLRWYDFRVSFKDLNNITTLNGLSEVDREALWTPRLDFINALGPIQVVMDDLSSGVLIRQSDPIPEDITLETEGTH